MQPTPARSGGESTSAGGAEGLQVRGLTVRFGGLLAVDAISLEAPPGRITGLIGPNGAGKTTTFSACTGLVRVTSGEVHLQGRNVTRAAPQARAALGLGRTFQRMELFETMTVRDNVALGREARVAGSSPWRQLRSTRAARRDALERADAALTECGLSDVADSTPARLSTGQRRLVELARACASGATTLLLDEPSSGLDRAETARFAEILVSVVDDRTGMLVVEHDMELVMSTCDYIYVLDFGKLIFEGTPADVRGSDVVRAAYLGSTDLQVSA